MDRGLGRVAGELQMDDPRYRVQTVGLHVDLRAQFLDQLSLSPTVAPREEDHGDLEP